VVGVTSSRAELIEIENIVKVFVVAERVIDLASEVKNDAINKNRSKKLKEINNHPNPYNQYLRPLNVRGFN
jgi:hypothetical protein